MSEIIEVTLSKIVLITTGSMRVGDSESSPFSGKCLQHRVSFLLKTPLFIRRGLSSPCNVAFKLAVVSSEEDAGLSFENSSVTFKFKSCLLYTSDAADER